MKRFQSFPHHRISYNEFKYFQQAKYDAAKEPFRLLKYNKYSTNSVTGKCGIFDVMNSYSLEGTTGSSPALLLSINNNYFVGATTLVTEAGTTNDRYTPIYFSPVIFNGQYKAITGQVDDNYTSISTTLNSNTNLINTSFSCPVGTTALFCHVYITPHFFNIMESSEASNYYPASLTTLTTNAFHEVVDSYNIVEQPYVQSYDNDESLSKNNEYIKLFQSLSNVPPTKEELALYKSTALNTIEVYDSSGNKVEASYQDVGVFIGTVCFIGSTNESNAFYCNYAFSSNEPLINRMSYVYAGNISYDYAALEADVLPKLQTSADNFQSAFEAFVKILTGYEYRLQHPITGFTDAFSAIQFMFCNSGTPYDTWTSGAYVPSAIGKAYTI